MGKFSGVMIVTDLDGTLLDSKKQISPACLQAIDRFMEQGGLFTVATGRVYDSFTCLMDRLKISGPVVFANGAQIFDMYNDRELYVCPLNHDIAALCDEILAQYPQVALEIFRHRRCDVVQINEISKEHMEKFCVPYETPAHTVDVPGPYLKVLFTGPHEQLEEIGEKLRAQRDDVTVCFSTKVFLEVFDRNASKGEGVRKLAEVMGVEACNVYAAGDQENDLDLLRAAHVAYAPANAADSVKALAHKILADNDHDMMAELIEDLESRYSDRESHLTK